MFAGRYRVGKRDGKTPTGVVVPGQEGNTRPITSPEIEEANSLPPLVTEVMSVVRLNWDFMTANEFNPIPYALSLLDGSSLGRDYESFCDIHDSLEKAMDLIVNDYHQAFNSAIQTFSSVVDTISESQKKVQEMRENLEKSKNWLECKRFDLLHLWVKSIQFKEMSRILESIDELQRSPTKIQTLIDGKYYLTAVKTLVSSIRTLNASDVVDIGAMDTVKEKLAQMSKQVYDLILEEIHDHLYLKTAPAMARIEPILNTSKENVEIAIGNEYQFFTRTKLDYVFDQIKPELFDDFESNPETNSFCYLQALVESLKVLDKLEDGLKVIDSRVTQELFGVVEKTIEEQEHSTTNQPLSHDGNFDDSPAENNPLASILLTLYDRFECIVMSHMFILKVASGEGGIDKDKVPYTASDICHAVQGEVKTVLYDYLITVEKTIASTNTVSSMNEILRDKRKPAERIGKQVFRINGASNSTLCVISENEDQDEIWKDADLAKCSVNDTLVGKGVVDKYANVLSNGHKPLIRPEASNILIAFKPTMQFTDSLEQAVGISPGVFHVFLEDFVLNVFLPQTHDLVTNFYHNFINGIDSFQTDQLPEPSFPLLKSVIALGYLLQSMCKMSNTIPIHKEEFLKSLEFILEKFHEKCLSRFRTLISTEQSGSENSGSISFAWTKNEKLTELMAENLFLTDAFDTPAQMNRNQAAWQKETDLEMKLKGERSFHRSELIFESRRLQGLAQLHYSMEWLAAQIMYMKGDTGSSTGLVATKVFENSVESLTEYVRLSSDSLPQLIVDSSELPQAEMTTEMANRFSVLANSFKALEKKCIYSLRVELRCHSMYYLDLALREGTYVSDDSNPSPDPYISMLNMDLSAAEEVVVTALPIRKTRFLFDGLGELMAQVLIFNLRYIRTVNLNGVLRLVRNIQSLQQNLTNLACAHQESLDRAKTYYELLGLDVEAILKMIPKNSGQYTYDEYKAILDLKFHDAIVEGGAAIKPYEETIVKLKRYFIDHRN
ncbi:hypothetical protein BDV3_007243 [Batrachochytrium dendrobatidis]|uniref:Exocyst complex component Sec8 n=1 Tax=Batrachochytrium dendrobatidis (strain JEL423) TaxID=403673 RepID=A0A177WQ05_BATDL|nr:exocyst subunit [Batrachochytrium dendrobatidis]KAK5667355.1 exocyst subunit [Batrachochytrium dendrobatidis]OAJ42198.1 hypothetical protein BDEG_25687 [Batrachochytrium dendrobatidis JEL423]